uniref:Uncharacterized protein n=1 Tax=Amphimedon queenslandica TaxID=400682 RepID=A0A1X7SHI6_AMPQE
NNCSFIIVVSDCTGSSEPLNISFNTSPTSTISNTPSPTISNPPTADGPGRSIAIILGIVAAAVIVVIILVIVIPTSIYFLRKKS